MTTFLIKWIDAKEQVRLLKENPPKHSVSYYHYAGTEVYSTVRYHFFTSELFIDGKRQRHDIIEHVAMNDEELAAVRVAKRMTGTRYTPVMTVN